MAFQQKVEIAEELATTLAESKGTVVVDYRGLNVAAFVQTHCHGDHISALTPLKTIYPKAPLYCPEAEVEWLPRKKRSGCASPSAPRIVGGYDGPGYRRNHALWQ